MSTRIPFMLPAIVITLGFFILLCSVKLLGVYDRHFFEAGPRVVAWQALRLLYIPYLLWLQYAVGSYAIRRIDAGVTGLPRVITACLLGTALWHSALLATGLAGLDTYPVMLLMAGGVMIASTRHLASLMANVPRGIWQRLGRREKIFWLLLGAAALAFLLLKATYPSGGHDYFNHYFTYYKEVVNTGHLGPHASWYHYYYSKGLGLVFMSMILLDPFAVHLVGSTLVIMAAMIVFDLLRQPGKSRVLPLFGVAVYLALYVSTPGRSLFALTGGWGDLEKTHELSAVFILGLLWLTIRWCETRRPVYAWALHAVNAALMIISFACLAIMGLFYALFFAVALLARRFDLARFAFLAGLSLGVSAVCILLLNYLITGLPQDQLALQFWPWINWQKVAALGYTLELYSHASDLATYSHYQLPLIASAPKIAWDFFRLYLLAPLLVMGVVLAMISRPTLRLPVAMRVLLLFLLASFLAALFLGGRSQPVSFFRFSTFNYAPMLVASLWLWRAASPRAQSLGAWLLILAAIPYIALQLPHVGQRWAALGHSALMLNSGQYSLRDALSDQRGRAGRMEWGGIYPALETIYGGLPAGTRIWNLHNRGYCQLPTCHSQQYFSQVISPRWYDIALGSVGEGKTIMQEEGLNFIFYSRTLPDSPPSDAKDQLSAFYPGLSPEHINDTFGILWTNGWDYLITWKENAVAPLDDNFLQSWRHYHAISIEPRKQRFPVSKLAPIMRDAVATGDFSRLPRYDQLAD